MSPLFFYFNEILKFSDSLNLYKIKMAMRVMREKKHQRWKKNLADIFDVSVIIIFSSEAPLELTLCVCKSITLSEKCNFFICYYR